MKDIKIKELEVKIKNMGAVYFREPTYKTQLLISELEKKGLLGIVEFLEGNFLRADFTLGGEEVTRDNIANLPTDKVNTIMNAYIKSFLAFVGVSKKGSKAKK